MWGRCSDRKTYFFTTFAIPGETAGWYSLALFINLTPMSQTLLHGQLVTHGVDHVGKIKFTASASDTSTGDCQSQERCDHLCILLTPAVNITACAATVESVDSLCWCREYSKKFEMVLVGLSIKSLRIREKTCSQKWVPSSHDTQPCLFDMQYMSP